MDKQELVERLLEATENIRLAEQEFVTLQQRLLEQEFTLKDQEARLLTAAMSPIDGKNAEVRAAQLFSLTGPEQVLIMDLKGQVAAKKADLDYYRALHRGLTACAYLLASGSDSEGGV